MLKNIMISGLARSLGNIVCGGQFDALIAELSSVACTELAAPMINLEKEYGDELKTAINVLFFNYP